MENYLLFEKSIANYEKVLIIFIITFILKII